MFKWEYPVLREIKKAHYWLLKVNIALPNLKLNSRESKKALLKWGYPHTAVDKCLFKAEFHP